MGATPNRCNEFADTPHEATPDRSLNLRIVGYGHDAAGDGNALVADVDPRPSDKLSNLML
jgi:hypothetical protein